MVIEKTMLLKIEEMTDYAYDVQKIKGEKDMYLVTDESVISIIEDLIGEYENLQDEFKKFKQDVEDNYKPIPMQELI